jgi:hypothetical protein
MYELSSSSYLGVVLAGYAPILPSVLGKLENCEYEFEYPGLTGLPPSVNEFW